MEMLGALALVIVAASMIVWPLLWGGNARPRATPPEPAPDRAKAAALAAIRELEFDFQTGKISSEDYAVLRTRYEAKAVEAMTAVGPEPHTFDAEIEAQVAALRTRHHCPACGQTLPASANFCPACGAVVGPGAAGERSATKGRS